MSILPSFAIYTRANISFRCHLATHHTSQFGHFSLRLLCQPYQLDKTRPFLRLRWSPSRAPQPPQQLCAPHRWRHLGQLPHLRPTLITAKQGQDKLPLFIRHLRQASPLPSPGYDSRKLRPPRLSGHIRDSLPEPLIANLVGHSEQTPVKVQAFVLFPLFCKQVKQCPHLRDTRRILGNECRLTRKRMVLLNNQATYLLLGRCVLQALQSQPCSFSNNRGNVFNWTLAILLYV